MTHPIRGVGEMPMVVDGGASGLEQSRHHPNAGLGAQNPTHADAQTSAAGNEDEGSDREINEIQTKIIGMVQIEMAEEVNSELLPSYLALHRHSRSKTEGIVAVAAGE